MIKSLWKLNVIMDLLRFFKYLLSEEMEKTSSLTYGLHSWAEDTDEPKPDETSINGPELIVISCVNLFTRGKEKCWVGSVCVVFPPPQNCIQAFIWVLVTRQ